MFKPGDIVIQDKTMVVNNINFKDNKKTRLCIVLFSFYQNDKLYYCTVPITNATRGTYKKMISKNHIYIPSLLLDNTKLCCVKINSIYLYESDNVHNASLKINNDILIKLYDKIINFECEDYQKELYDFVKIKIQDIIDTLEKNIKNEKKLQKKLRKEKRKELKRGYSEFK